MYKIKTTPSLQAQKLDAILRESMRRAMLTRGINAQEVADELSKRSGRSITPGLVNAWIAKQRHRWHLPADLVPAVCEFLGDDTIQRLLLSDKLRHALTLGESTQQVVSLLRSALANGRQRKSRSGKTAKRSKR